jgi:dTDP-glucose pyrophosphorylase
LACGWDGYILTFGHDRPWPGPAWSYAVVDEWLQVQQVVEKPKTNIGPHATVGFYWWRRAGDLVWAICDMIANHVTVNGEYYLAPAYNRLLSCRNGEHATSIVKIVPVNNFVGLGTPEQVKSFEQASLVREP